MNSASDQQNAKLLVADFKQRVRAHLGGGLYKEGDVFLERPHIDGRQTWRKLDARTERLARLEIGKKRSDQALSRRGLATDPYKPQLAASSVGFVLEFYLEAGCPKRRAGERTSQTAREEKTRVQVKLLPFWKNKAAVEVTPETQMRFRDWLLTRLTRKANGDQRGRGGLREVDKCLITLSNSFHWAVLNQQKTGITKNPLREARIVFRNPKHVKHCRDNMPANADELHAIARYLFSSDRSQVLGWLHLFQAMIGQRVSELVRLRLDAGHEQAGYLTRRKDGRIANCLYLYRSETSKGTFPYADIHHDLRDCLEAFLNWNTSNYPRSPWFFPSPEDPSKPISPEALTHALRRICPAIGIPHKTSHGNRSYFVNVLRSQGKTDGEIALRIGQRTGGKLIVEVYGEILPYKLTWRPETGEPAWQRWSTNPQLELGL